MGVSDALVGVVDARLKVGVGLLTAGGGVRPPRHQPNARLIHPVDIVVLHSCPDDDRSMAIETVGIKFSLLKDNVRVGVARSN